MSQEHIKMSVERRRKLFYVILSGLMLLGLGSLVYGIYVGTKRPGTKTTDDSAVVKASKVELIAF
jgi:hypothetical protein